MASKWRKAVWEAVQRRAVAGSVTRSELIELELDRIVLEVGSKGKTPSARCAIVCSKAQPLSGVTLLGVVQLVTWTAEHDMPVLPKMLR